VRIKGKGKAKAAEIDVGRWSFITAGGLKLLRSRGDKFYTVSTFEDLRGGIWDLPGRRGLAGSGTRRDGYASEDGRSEDERKIWLKNASLRG